MKLTVDKWFVDKGFGFGTAPSGEVVFIHASAVQGAEVLVVGTDAWTQVVSDRARAKGGYRARKAWGQEKDRERASRAAQQVRRAATLTAELAAQSENKVFEVCSQPPGLYDEPAAERSVEPPAAKSSRLVSDSPPCSPLSLTTSETAASTLLVTNKPLQRAKGLQNNAAAVDHASPRHRRSAGRDTESLRRSNWQERSINETATHEYEARGAAAESRILENTRGGEATLPHKEEGSAGVLQKAAKLQTQGAGGIRVTIQAEK